MPAAQDTNSYMKAIFDSCLTIASIAVCSLVRSGAAFGFTYCV